MYTDSLCEFIYVAVLLSLEDAVYLELVTNSGSHGLSISSSA